MSNPTSSFGWQMPTSSDLVTDLPADFEVFGQAVDTSLADLKGGTTGQILSKASNTDMDFTWTTAAPGDITSVTAGTGISGGGTSGDVTITNSMATAITTNGDLIYGTGSGTFTRRGIGSTGDVLTVSGGVPTWATPAAGGGFTVIASGSLSGNSLNLTSIPQTYKYIRLQMLNIKTSSSGSAPALQMTYNGESVGGAQTTYCEGGLRIDQTGAASAYSPTGYSGTYSLLGLTGGFADSTTTLANVTLDWNNYSDTTSAKIALGSSYTNWSSAGAARFNHEQILWRNANAITQITIKVESSYTYSSGTYVLYGVN